MKKMIALVLALMLALSLVACGGNKTETPNDPAFSADLAAFYEQMMNAAEEGPFMMNLLEEAEIMDFYYPGLKDIETKQLVAYAPAMTAVAAEFVFVEVANAADVETVKDILQARIDAQVAGGAGYPMTIEQWAKYSEIVVIDNYVCLFVNTDKDLIIDAFRNNTEVPLWAKAPIYLDEFYDELYYELYPMDEEGNYTGPYAEDITWYDGAEEMIEMYYPGLTAIDANQLHVYIPGMSFSAYEVVLIEVVNESDVEAVKAILQARVDAQAAGGAWYPEAVEGWVNNARIVSNGCYIMLAVGADCDAFVDGFNSLF